MTIPVAPMHQFLHWFKNEHFLKVANISRIFMWLIVSFVASIRYLYKSCHYLVYTTAKWLQAGAYHGWLMEIPWCVSLSWWQGRLLRCSLHFLCEELCFSCAWNSSMQLMYSWLTEADLGDEGPAGAKWLRLDYTSRCNRYDYCHFIPP